MVSISRLKCVKYADTNKYSPHDCNKGDNWLFKDTNADDDLECTLRGGSNCEYYNDGHYCVMPSHGGWPLANEQFGDGKIQVDRTIKSFLFTKRKRYNGY